MTNRAAVPADAQASAHNLAALLTRRAEVNQPALTWASGSFTYAQLTAYTGAARSFLQEQGVQPGDRVALALPNVPVMVALYYASLSLGAIVVPLHPLLTPREVAYHLRDAGARLLLAGAGTRVGEELEQTNQLVGGTIQLELLALDEDFGLASQASPGQSWEPHPVTQNTPAVLLYTSGTTGLPKGATLTHANMLSNAETCVDVFGFTQQDVIFGGLPLFHAFGQTVSMNAVLAAGASIALLPRFTPGGAAQLCAAASVTVLAAVPTMYSALATYLATDPALSGQLHGQIRSGISGGSALPASVHTALDNLLGCPIYEGYGLSETAPVVSFNRAEYGLVIGSVGRALPGVRVKVVDRDGAEVAAGRRGELWVAGPNVMAGYWQNSAATEAVMQGEWFATGDVATLDGQGNIFIVDRLKDMILRNGNSVYPREIEDVLYTHQSVRLAAVVGQPSEAVGEEIVAVIVPTDELEVGEQAELAASLDAHSRSQLAAYKCPRRYIFKTDLPLGPTGKILKRVLAEELAREV
ncbi:long-chain fatty acid--CoA ligase [Rothia nasimurium]|uniref:Long-chain fatty acid--CoA ligase n=1 Tax=Rothia nasimurium TaxID=85336 RepID=A0A1Y1RRH2_9MICC|nr:AMP-binding protein [Rothia nasimurium]ORC22556.1 long-chain fatty acid--CoA ligase [Rothia nasimurium]